ncbi:hypothetical protein NQZ68_015572 [Dissostichus eleginoides]|nr:hypothetical protein NQZ68_015572 [Dissostichus eleginoides]
MAQYSWISRFPSGLKMNDLVVWPSELPLFLFDIPETPCLFVDSASESLALPEFELLEVSALPSLLGGGASVKLV